MDWDWREVPYGVEYDYTDEEFLNKTWNTKCVSDIELIEYLKDIGVTGSQIAEDDFEEIDLHNYLQKNYVEIVKSYWEDVLEKDLI